MPSIQKRGSNYRIMVSMGYDMEGKQIRKTTTFTPPAGVTEGKAEKLAKAYAYEFEKQCRGMVNLDENIRFHELFEWYYDQIAPHKLKEYTLNSSRYILEIYVLPYIGNMKLKDISTARIDALFNELHHHGSKREMYMLKDADLLAYGTRRPLSRKSGVNLNTLRDMANGKAVKKSTAERVAQACGKTLKQAFTLTESKGGLEDGTIARIRTALSPIFSTAVKKDLLLKNPVMNATTPKDTDTEERAYLNAEQCRELLEIINEFTNPQLTRLIKVLLFTGMRVGEITGLHWEDVDFKHSMLTVRYSLYRSKGQYKLGTPKTKSSARVISLPPQVMETLAEQKEWQEHQKQAAGSLWIERGTVFTGMYGEYMNVTYVNTKFKELLKKHNFPNVHTHDLRHANASLLINMGVPVKVISEHLGHCDTRTTENIYAHIFAETRARAADVISQALGTVGNH